MFCSSRSLPYLKQVARWNRQLGESAELNGKEQQGIGVRVSARGSGEDVIYRSSVPSAQPGIETVSR